MNGGERRKREGEEICPITFIYLHTPSYTFMDLYVPSYTFIYIQIAPYTFIYPRIPQNI